MRVSHSREVIRRSGLLVSCAFACRQRTAVSLRVSSQLDDGAAAQCCCDAVFPADPRRGMTPELVRRSGDPMDVSTVVCESAAASGASQDARIF